MLSYLLYASLLLHGGAELPDKAVLEKEGFFIRLCVQGIAVQDEVLDPRELRYVLARNEDFASDMRMLHRRVEELRYAPYVCDAFRFPPREVVNELLAFNRSYRSFLEHQQPIILAGGWHRRAMCRTDHLYQVWDCVRDCRCEYYYVTVRRQALAKIRELVGEDAYYAGDLPPHVPLEFFVDLDQDR